VVVIASIALHVTHEGGQPPRADPAQPLGLERVGDRAIERDRRHRPRAVRQDQAALPARAPPAILRTGGDDPVAELAGEIRTVGAKSFVVLGVGDDGQFEASAPAVAEEAAGPTGEFAFLAWFVVESAQYRGTSGGTDLDADGGATFSGNLAKPSDGCGLGGGQVSLSRLGGRGPG
jgi:hypothetical protein